jgi:hypothetical protein
MPDTDTPTSPKNNQVPPAKPKDRPTKTLPTDRIAFSRQLDILRAYAAASGPTGQAVTNDAVGKIVQLNSSTVSLANAFFLGLGFLQKTDLGYIPSPEVVAFNRAHSWNPDTAAHKLADLIQKAWFAQAVLPRLSFRPLDEEEALSVLADASNAGTDYKDQLRVLLNYMEAAGLINREGNTIRLSQPVSGASTSSSSTSSPAPLAVSVSERVGGLQGLGEARAEATFQGKPAGGVAFKIDVNVKMDELAGWSADRIAALFEGIAKVVAAKSGGEMVK